MTFLVLPSLSTCQQVQAFICLLQTTSTLLQHSGLLLTDIVNLGMCQAGANTDHHKLQKSPPEKNIWSQDRVRVQ